MGKTIGERACSCLRQLWKLGNFCSLESTTCVHVVVKLRNHAMGVNGQTIMINRGGESITAFHILLNNDVQDLSFWAMLAGSARSSNSISGVTGPSALDYKYITKESDETALTIISLCSATPSCFSPSLTHFWYLKRKACCLLQDHPHLKTKLLFFNSFFQLNLAI